MKQTRGEATRKRRELIVETAARCFLERGFHQTSVRDIAREAGISLGNLYNHFPGKEALIAEIATLEAAELQELEQALRDTDDPAKTLDRFVSGYLTYVSKRENVVLGAEITTEALRDPGIAERFLENRGRLCAGLSDLLGGGIDQGIYRKGMATDETAEQIIDLIEGVAYRSAFAGEKPTRRAIKALKETIERAVST